jgi:hypothetical protein
MESLARALALGVRLYIVFVIVAGLILGLTGGAHLR